MQKKIVIAICIGVLSVMLGLILIVSLNTSEPEKPEIKPPVSSGESGSVQAPSKVDEDERQVTSKKENELFNFIPKVYTEGFAPFSSLFMLDAVMGKIMDSNENYDFSTNYVDNYVKKIFGESAVINKEEVATPDVGKSLFYYSKEAKTYAVIPVGYEGIFEYQIFKNATETDDAYYVYTYTLIGGYSYDEASITQDEFGDISYEDVKVQVIVGDKDGNDLVHVFDNYSYIYDEEIWLENYKNIMPIFRYTLKKDGKNFYLTEVEQINY